MKRLILALLMISPLIANANYCTRENLDMLAEQNDDMIYNYDSLIDDLNDSFSFELSTASCSKLYVYKNNFKSFTENADILEEDLLSTFKKWSKVLSDCASGSSKESEATKGYNIVVKRYNSMKNEGSNFNEIKIKAVNKLSKLEKICN